MKENQFWKGRGAHGTRRAQAQRGYLRLLTAPNAEQFELFCGSLCRKTIDALSEMAEAGGRARRTESFREL